MNHSNSSVDFEQQILAKLYIRDQMGTAKYLVWHSQYIKKYERCYNGEAI